MAAPPKRLIIWILTLLSVQAAVCTNGTAVVLVNVARRSNRRGTCPVRPGNCPGARRAWRVFLQSGYKVYWVLVRSRYKFDRWLKSCHGSRRLVNGHMRSIAIQVVRKPKNGHDILRLYYVQMRESGCKNHYVTVMLADAKAKTVTSLLPQLTVLLLVLLYFLSVFVVLIF